MRQWVVQVNQAMKDFLRMDPAAPSAMSTPASPAVRRKRFEITQMELLRPPPSLDEADSGWMSTRCVVSRGVNRLHGPTPDSSHCRYHASCATSQTPTDPVFFVDRRVAETAADHNTTVWRRG